MLRLLRKRVAVSPGAARKKEQDGNKANRARRGKSNIKGLSLRCAASRIVHFLCSPLLAPGALRFSIPLRSPVILKKIQGPKFKRPFRPAPL